MGEWKCSAFYPTYHVTNIYTLSILTFIILHLHYCQWFHLGLGTLTSCEDEFGHLFWLSRGKSYKKAQSKKVFPTCKKWLPSSVLLKMAMKPLVSKMKIEKLPFTVAYLTSCSYWFWIIFSSRFISFIVITAFII